MRSESSCGDAREHHVEVTRGARYWTLGDAGGDRPEAWVVLHGYAQLARRFLARFEGMAGPERLVVAPEALSRFYVKPTMGRHGTQSVVGATWMTREDREQEVKDYVAYLDRLAAAAVPPQARLTVLGFSQGVATAWRWATYGNAPAPLRLILWAGRLPPDLDMDRAAAALARTEVVLVAGDLDRTVGDALSADELTRLSDAGLSHRVVRYSGGHEIDESTLQRIAVD
jgi:predicted esterase